MTSKTYAIAASIAIFAGASLFLIKTTRTLSFSQKERDTISQTKTAAVQRPTPTINPAILRLSPVPATVKAVYLTAWSAGNETKINEIIKLADATELNAVVIDVKDYTGEVAFRTQSEQLRAVGSETDKIKDLPQLVSRLHERNIYVIARIAAFQDPLLAGRKPELAILDSRTQKPWKDNKGLSWVDPADTRVWDYLIEVANQAIKAGVDEINFDYVRFPSDGNLATLQYQTYNARALTKADQLKQFFKYLNGKLKPTGAVLSADLFGLSTLNTDDLGIGQVLENALLYFDYVSPMVYPSHYASGSFGYKNPALYPYDVVYQSLTSAMAKRNRLIAALTASSTQALASSTSQLAPSPKTPIMVQVGTIRPWLQAFNLGATYTPDMVRKQIQATQDAGFTSGWYIWNPSNVYNAAAFLPQQ